jgi:hypothetical protein
MGSINDPTRHGELGEEKELACDGCGDVIDGEVMNGLCLSCIESAINELDELKGYEVAFSGYMNLRICKK